MRINAIFVMMVVLAGVLSAALSVDTYTVTPSTLKPGEQGAITFTVKNVLPSSATTSVDPLENVQVFFGSTSPGIEFKAKSPFVIGTIDSGGSALVSVPFEVMPTAKGGVLTTSFFISQKDKTDLKTVNVVIKVVNPPILTLSSDRQTVLGTDNIKLTITNNGGSASRLSLKLAQGSDFSFIGRTEVYIGDVATSATVDVPLDARNVEEGVTEIPFVLFFQQEGGDSVNESKSLTVAVKKEKADVVITQADTVVTARDNVLKLKIKNTGRALEDFKLYLEDEHIKALESKLVRVGTLETGAEKEIALQVFVDAEPGVRRTNVTLTWVEDNVEKEEKATVQIFVNSDSDAAIFVDAKPTPIIVGGDHTLSVLVSNVGSYKIQNVEVNVPPSGTFEVLNAQTTQYIGGLEADDFSTVQYRVKVKATSPGSYPLAVMVRYKDQSGVWVEKNSTVQLSVRSPSDVASNGSGGDMTPIILVVLVAGGAAIWYFKFRKKDEKGAKKAPSAHS